jgi:putative transposase
MTFVRRAPLVTGEYYHVFNRGVARAPTFYTKADYRQAMLALSYYRFVKPQIPLSRFKELENQKQEDMLYSLQNSAKHAEIIAFVFMPNHFHFLLKQTYDNGISKFLSQFTNSYTRYVNTMHERVGPLFQGLFKSVHVETEEQLLHLSRYIHLNPVVSNVIYEDDIFSYPWSSLPEYFDSSHPLTSPESVLELCKSKEAYRAFLLDHVGYAKELAKIKHLTFDK